MYATYRTYKAGMDQIQASALTAKSAIYKTSMTENVLYKPHFR